MKKSELKKILKPLVKECIKEVMFEDGVLSGIITEVARGITNTQPVAVAEAPPEDEATSRLRRNAFGGEPNTKLQEQRTKLMKAIDRDAYNGVDLFEGTTPAPAQASPSQQAQPLSGQPAADPGVDITSLMGTVGRNWNAHMTDVKEKERG